MILSIFGFSIEYVKFNAWHKFNQIKYEKIVICEKSVALTILFIEHVPRKRPDIYH